MMLPACNKTPIKTQKIDHNSFLLIYFCGEIKDQIDEHFKKAIEKHKRAKKRPTNQFFDCCYENSFNSSALNKKYSCCYEKLANENNTDSALASRGMVVKKNKLTSCCYEDQLMLYNNNNFLNNNINESDYFFISNQQPNENNNDYYTSFYSPYLPHSFPQQTQPSQQILLQQYNYQHQPLFVPSQPPHSQKLNLNSCRFSAASFSVVRRRSFTEEVAITPLSIPHDLSARLPTQLTNNLSSGLPTNQVLSSDSTSFLPFRSFQNTFAPNTNELKHDWDQCQYYKNNFFTGGNFENNFIDNNDADRTNIVPNNFFNNINTKLYDFDDNQLNSLSCKNNQHKETGLSNYCNNTTFNANRKDSCRRKRNNMAIYSSCRYDNKKSGDFQEKYNKNEIEEEEEEDEEEEEKEEGCAVDYSKNNTEDVSKVMPGAYNVDINNNNNKNNTNKHSSNIDTNKNNHYDKDNSKSDVFCSFSKENNIENNGKNKSNHYIMVL